MKLLIVESPGKIKKIKSILGSDWDVAASIGHIRDLPKKSLGIDKSNNYELLYEISEDKKAVVSGLRSKVNRVGVENVYLATDEDREGEAISFHLCEVLGLSTKTTKRVTFNEITATAVSTAINNPRKVDMDLVHAYECRRAIDRLVGFEISPVLWEFIKGQKGLSAGRVQSPAVRMIVQREREIKKFSDTFKFIITGSFLTHNNELLKARLQGVELQNEIMANGYLNGCKEKTFKISVVTKERIGKNPEAPFSTSSLQQDAYKKFKFPVKKTMDLAQKLYESGMITYMRTDSVNLSQDAVNEAKEYIEKKFGKEYFSKRTFKNKSENAQEAHEAIRPTHFNQIESNIGIDEDKLYNLIFHRALASQMAATTLDKTTILIENNRDKDLFVSTASVIVFDGYLKGYGEIIDPDDNDNDDGKDNDNTLKFLVEKGNILKYSFIRAAQTFGNPPKRYDEASLINELEKKEIGRPSTYASILTTIKTREYIKTDTIKGKKVNIVIFELAGGQLKKKESSQTIGGDKNKFIPTEAGEIIVKFLELHFTEMIQYEFTASIEKRFDDIMEKKDTYLDVINIFDKDLIEQITTTMNSGEAKQNLQKTKGLACPKCKIGEMKPGEKNWWCSRYKDEIPCSFKIWKSLAGKNLNDTNIKTLLEKGKAGPFLFVSKSNPEKNKKESEFEAYIKIEEGVIKFEFPQIPKKGFIKKQ